MKKLGAAILIAWLGAGATAIYLWWQLDALRSERAGLQARVATLETRAPVAAAIAPQAPLAEAPTAPVAPASAATVEQAIASPENIDFRRSMLRATLPARYPDLSKELGLTSDQLDKFEDLLTRQSMSQTFGRSPAEQAEVSALLGEKYSQWQVYQDSLPGRLQVSLLREQLAASGAALSDAQAKPLMAALNAELKSIQEERPPPPLKSAEEMRSRDVQRAAEFNRRMVEAATPYLDAQQLGRYRQLLDQLLHMGQMTTDIMNTVMRPQLPARPGTP